MRQEMRRRRWPRAYGRVEEVAWSQEDIEDVEYVEEDGLEPGVEEEAVA